MKKYILFPVVCCIIVLAGCKKSYLDTAPTDETSPETVFATTQNAALAVNGLAVMMTMQYIGSQGFNGEGTIKMWYGNYPGENFYVNLPGWAAIINHTNNEVSTSTYTYYPWFYYYKIIGNANTIIARIDNAVGTQAERDFIKAQALTYRAYCYMMLVQLYGNRWSDSQNGATKAVALRLDESSGDIAASSLGDCYKQIYKDLDDALALFTSSGKKRTAGKNFEVDANVAYAVYARAALNKQDYPNAELYAGKARVGYALMNVAAYKDGFANPTSEWIWSSHGALDETLFFYSYHAYIAYNSTASAVRTTPKCMSKVLFNKIPATDIRKKLFLDPTGYTYNTATGAASPTTTYKKLDSVARVLYPTLQSNATVFAYMQFKVKNNEQAGVGHLNHFRSSEMLLIEAEAKYHNNKPASEVQALLVELNKTSGRDPNYAATNTGTALLNEIKFYRNVELWGEGFDWFDLKRWGDTIDRLSTDNGGSFPGALAVKITPEQNNKWTWVIPNKEFDYNSLIRD